MSSALPSPEAIREARRYRLPTTVRPGDVDLHLEIDPDGPGGFTGRLEMDLELSEPTSTLTLHALELDVSHAEVGWADVSTSPLRADIEVDPLREVVQLDFDRELPTGHARLAIEFNGRHRDDLMGLYGVTCRQQHFVFSQLCTTMARHLFPCFDEPGFKARYSIHVTTPISNEVVSNMPVHETHVLDDGRKTVEFERTPLLSTYLLALAVGLLETSREVRSGDVPIRVVATPGKVALTELALDVARRALPVLEAWFGIPYPYPKLDLVAVPDFSFGAMENAGAVFFRETLLLADPDTLSFDERKRLTETICHELAHMWFGNLVTMAWWDDLWLNESFATWMAFHVVGEIEPEWSTWQTFQHRKDAALDLDALEHTHPVYLPVASAEEANENFDLITYEKGASVIRMLAGYLGPEVFRAGVRRYIETHREGNARAADLWAAFEAGSAVPVARIMKAWIELAGHPVVTVGRQDEHAAAVVTLEQGLHRTVPASPTNESAPHWPVPWIGRVSRSGATSEIRVLLETQATTAPLGEVDWLYGNGGEAGFYRPLHTRELTAALYRDVGGLAPIERQGFAAHQWALVQAGRIPVDDFIDLVDRLTTEDDPDVLHAVGAAVGALGRGVVQELSESARVGFAGWARDGFGPRLAAMGTEPAAGDDEVRRRARAALLVLAGEIGEAPELIEIAHALGPDILANRGGTDPELASSWLRLAGRFGDASYYEACLRSLSDSPTPQGRQRALFALTELSTPELADRTLQRCADGKVSTQDVVFVLGRCLHHPMIRHRAWRFIQQHWDELARHLPPMHVPRLIAATAALRDRTAKREVERFFGERDLPSTRRALRQTSERFEAAAALDAHALDALEKRFTAE